jgi:hypothetical protein
MTCDCGFSNSPAAKFCGECGRPLGSAAPSSCVACGHDLIAGAKFCENCATPVDTGRRANPQPQPEPSPPPSPPPSPHKRNNDEEDDRRSGKFRFVGSVLVLPNVPSGSVITLKFSMRLQQTGVRQRPVEVTLNFRQARAVGRLLQPGDEVEAEGVWQPDGTLRLDYLENNRTKVVIIKRKIKSGTILIFIILIVCECFIFAALTGARTASDRQFLGSAFLGLLLLGFVGVCLVLSRSGRIKRPKGSR